MKTLPVTSRGKLRKRHPVAPLSREHDAATTSPLPDATSRTKSEQVVNSAEPNGVPSHKQVEALAYRLYLQRGKQPGHALEDWLEAEKRLRSQIAEEMAYRLELGHGWPGASM